MPSQTANSGNSAQPQVPPHQHSCTICRQRKVKCDKQQRCSNCVKAGVECVYGLPGRPRRRMGNGTGISAQEVSKEELLHRLRRYETLFRKHGLKFETSDLKSSDSTTLHLKSSYSVTDATIVLDQVTGRHGEDLKQAE